MKTLERTEKLRLCGAPALAPRFLDRGRQESWQVGHGQPLLLPGWASLPGLHGDPRPLGMKANPSKSRGPLTEWLGPHGIANTTYYTSGTGQVLYSEVNQGSSMSLGVRMKIWGFQLH